MGHVRGVARGQGTLFPERLDDLIEPDNPVRVIDAFVAGVDLAALGFRYVEPARAGRPPYDPADLLKLYLYGYMNRLRSSRELARACRRNIELMWLLHRLAPCHKTIAAFRSAQPQALRGVCRAFVRFCREAGVFGGEVVAVDGSKFQADNALGRHVTRGQLARERGAIERRIEAYLEELDRADAEHAEDDEEDGDGGSGGGAAVREALERLERRRDRLGRLDEELAEAGEEARALTDAEARKMRAPQGGGYLVGYNVQIAVEAERRLIVHHEVSDEANDRRLLLGMARAAKAALGGAELTLLADSGYAQAEGLRALALEEILAIVPRQPPHSPHPGLGREHFAYDPLTDRYRCPAGAELTFRGERAGQRRYRARSCRGCALKPRCTTAAARTVTRHRHEAALEAADRRARGSPEWMRLRRATVEHPFGGLKHNHAARRFLTRGLAKVRGEMALSVLAYNLKRTIALLGVEGLMAALAHQRHGEPAPA